MDDDDRNCRTLQLVRRYRVVHFQELVAIVKLMQYSGFDGCDWKVSLMTNVVAIVVDGSLRIRMVVEKEREICNWYQWNTQHQGKRRRMIVHEKGKGVSD